MRIHDHLAQTGAPAFRFGQLIAAWQSSTAETFADVHALPAGLRADLAERFGPRLHPLTPLEVQRDEQVEKVLFASESGARIETVVSHYRAGWDSMCISSQAGCGLGCTFCATGAVGLVRNLTADEIVAQVMHPHWTREGLPRPASVAFMGGVNDSDDHLAALAELVRARSRPELFHVSVIRYNEAAGAPSDYRAPSSIRVDEFVRGLAVRGVHTTRRRQFGTGIDAACGQLHAKYLAADPTIAAPVTSLRS